MDAFRANAYKNLYKPRSECYHTSCVSHLHAALIKNASVMAAQWKL